MKILFNTSKLNGYTVKYYLTHDTANGLSYYGIMLTSEKNNNSYSAQVSGIFPYKANAVTLLAYLVKHKVTPLSMKETVIEYMDNKFISC